MGLHAADDLIAKEPPLPFFTSFYQKYYDKLDTKAASEIALDFLLYIYHISFLTLAERVHLAFSLHKKHPSERSLYSLLQAANASCNLLTYQSKLAHHIFGSLTDFPKKKLTPLTKMVLANKRMDCLLLRSLQLVDEQKPFVSVTSSQSPFSVLPIGPGLSKTDNDEKALSLNSAPMPNLLTLYASTHILNRVFNTSRETLDRYGTHDRKGYRFTFFLRFLESHVLLLTYFSYFIGGETETRWNKFLERGNPFEKALKYYASLDLTGAVSTNKRGNAKKMKEGKPFVFQRSDVPLYDKDELVTDPSFLGSLEEMFELTNSLMKEYQDLTEQHHNVLSLDALQINIDEIQSITKIPFINEVKKFKLSDNAYDFYMNKQVGCATDTFDVYCYGVLVVKLIDEYNRLLSIGNFNSLLLRNVRRVLTNDYRFSLHHIVINLLSTTSEKEAMMTALKDRALTATKKEEDRRLLMKPFAIYGENALKILELVEERGRNQIWEKLEKQRKQPAITVIPVIPIEPKSRKAPIATENNIVRKVPKITANRKNSGNPTKLRRLSRHPQNNSQADYATGNQDYVSQALQTSTHIENAFENEEGVFNLEETINEVFSSIDFGSESDADSFHSRRPELEAPNDNSNFVDNTHLQQIQTGTENVFDNIFPPQSNGEMRSSNAFSTFPMQLPDANALMKDPLWYNQQPGPVSTEETLYGYIGTNDNIYQYPPFPNNGIPSHHQSQQVNEFAFEQPSVVQSQIPGTMNYYPPPVIQPQNQEENNYYPPSVVQPQNQAENNYYPPSVVQPQNQAEMNYYPPPIIQSQNQEDMNYYPPPVVQPHISGMMNYYPPPINQPQIPGMMNYYQPSVVQPQNEEELNYFPPPVVQPQNQGEINYYPPPAIQPQNQAEMNYYPPPVIQPQNQEEMNYYPPPVIQPQNQGEMSYYQPPVVQPPVPSEMYHDHSYEINENYRDYYVPSEQHIIHEENKMEHNTESHPENQSEPEYTKGKQDVIEVIQLTESPVVNKFDASLHASRKKAERVEKMKNLKPRYERESQEAADHDMYTKIHRNPLMTAPMNRDPPEEWTSEEKNNYRALIDHLHRRDSYANIVSMVQSQTSYYHAVTREMEFFNIINEPVRIEDHILRLQCNEPLMDYPPQVNDGSNRHMSLLPNNSLTHQSSYERALRTVFSERQEFINKYSFLYYLDVTGKEELEVERPRRITELYLSLDQLEESSEINSYFLAVIYLKSQFKLEAPLNTLLHFLDPVLDYLSVNKT